MRHTGGFHFHLSCFYFIAKKGISILKDFLKHSQKHPKVREAWRKYKVFFKIMSFFVLFVFSEKLYKAFYLDYLNMSFIILMNKSKGFFVWDSLIFIWMICVDAIVSHYVLLLCHSPNTFNPKHPVLILGFVGDGIWNNIKCS